MERSSPSSRGTLAAVLAALVGAALPPAGWLLRENSQEPSTESVAAAVVQGDVDIPSESISLREQAAALRASYREKNEMVRLRGEERRHGRLAALSENVATRQAAFQRVLEIDRELRGNRDATQIHRTRDLAREAIASAHAQPSAATQVAGSYRDDFYARGRANIDVVQQHQAAEIALVESDNKTRLAVARVGVVVVAAVATAGIASAASAPAAAGASTTAAATAEGSAAVAASGTAAAETAVVAAEGGAAVVAAGDTAITAGTVAEMVGTNVAVSTGIEAGSSVIAADGGVITAQPLASSTALADSGLPLINTRSVATATDGALLPYPQCTAAEPIGFCQVTPIGPQPLTEPLSCNLYTTYTNGVAGNYVGTVNDAQILSNHLGRPVLVNYDPPTGNALDGLFKLGQGKVAPFADFETSAATNRLGNFYGEVLSKDGSNAIQSIVHSRGTITNANAQVAAVSGQYGHSVTDVDLLTRSSTTAFGPGHTQFRFPTTTVQFSGDPIPRISSFVEEQFGLPILRGEFSPAAQSFTLPSDGFAHSAASYFSRLPEVPNALPLPANCWPQSSLPRVWR